MDSSAKRTKPTMQTSGGMMMGGAPMHSEIPQRIVPQATGSAADLKFDEIVLESNEIDLAELQAASGFTERRFP